MVYLSCEFSTDHEKAVCFDIMDKIKASGKEIYEKDTYANDSSTYLADTLNAICACDELVIIKFGNKDEANIAWECGYAYANGIKTTIITDNVSVMSTLMYESCAELISVDKYLA